MIRNRISRVLVLFVSLLALVAGAQMASAQQEQIVGSTDGALSIHAPAGWVATNLPTGPVFSAIIVVAQDQTVLDTVVRNITSGVSAAAAPGAYGIVSILSPQAWTMLSGDPQQALLMYMDAITRTNMTPDTTVTVNQVFQANIGGANGIIYDVSTSQKLNSRGYIGGVVFNNSIVTFQLAVSPASSFDANAQLLQALGSTIRVPAEPGAVTATAFGTSPTPVQLQTLPTLPPANGLPTQPPLNPPTLAPALQSTPVMAAPSPAATVQPVIQRSSGDRLSVWLPPSWVFIDQAAEQGIAGFGDSEAAAQSRIGAIRPDLVNPPVTITGNGGVVVLYKMSDFGVDPAAPDLKPLLDRVLGGLRNSGYQVVIEPRAAAIGPAQALVTVVSGAETGFLVLAPFGDQIAYITCTTTGPADALMANPALQEQLAQVVLSVRVPAEQPVSGGGLGGLQALPTATPGGGLGGLQAPASTPETDG